MYEKGNTAEVLDYGATRVCKLFYPGIPYEYVKQEYENGRKLFKLGIRVPEAFEIVSEGGRYGIIYEKIVGVSMRECIDSRRMFDAFIVAHKKLLDISTDVLMSYKDFLIAMIERVNNGGKSEDLIEEIQALPEGNFVLHGDYHPANVLIDGDGELVMIDLLNVCRGPREYDVARTFFLLENEKRQDWYLKGMGYRREEIEGYLNIIWRTRKYESDI